MASSLTIQRFLLMILIVCTIILSCTSGDDDYEPEVGPIGKQLGHEEGEGGGEEHGHEGSGEEGGGEEHGGEEGGGEEHGGEEHGGEEGSGEEHGHEGGEGDDEGGSDHGGDPAHIVDGALLCFHEKHIYSSCEEPCRLSASGELHVPPDHVDEFCNGPCIEETNHVLDCLDGIMEHFLFYNKATTRDVRDTVLAGCGHGEHRGDFDVGEHIEDEGSKRNINTLLSGIVIIAVWQILQL